jgi:hypothetical protein
MISFVNKSTAALALVAIVTGCASYRSTYRRGAAASGELVWAYDDGFQVTRDGRVIAERGSWDGLSGAVRCVPQAREWVDSADSRDGWGKLLLWGGMVVMLAGVGVGTALVVDDFDDTDQVVTGLALMGGGLVFGGVTIPTGAVLRAKAEAQAIDAVNLYNDERWAGRCR